MSLNNLRFSFPLSILRASRLAAMDFTATSPLYVAPFKPSNVTTVECWFKVDSKCPEGAIIFDQLVESDRSAYRLEIGKGTLRLVNTVGASGVKTAQVMYHTDGWVCHYNTDLWRSTAPIDGVCGMWMMGGAWLSTHLWEHYQFTEDTDFLKRVYPAMKGSAAFLFGNLVEEPTHHWLVISPSYSPENGTLAIGSTIDQSITRDVFSEVIEAGNILKVDDDFRAKVVAAQARLAPLQIGKLGQLQEWLTDIDSPTDHNRHASHLYTVFPSNQITPTRRSRSTATSGSPPASPKC